MSSGDSGRRGAGEMTEPEGPFYGVHCGYWIRLFETRAEAFAYREGVKSGGAFNAGTVVEMTIRDVEARVAITGEGETDG
jgi:hypothetical protein